MLLDRATGRVARPDRRLRLLGRGLPLGAGLEERSSSRRRCAAARRSTGSRSRAARRSPLWTGGGVARPRGRGQPDRFLRHEHALARPGALDASASTARRRRRSRTSTTRCFRELALGEVSERFTDSSDGRKLQAWVVKPPFFDAVEEVSGGLPHPRRAAGRLDGRLVVPLEPAGLGGLRLRGLRRESARLDRIRPGVSRRDQRRLGRAGLRRPDAAGRRPGVAAVRRRARRSARRARRTAATWSTGSPGHTDRFQALVSHDGTFDLASANLETEELWFPEVGVQGLALELGPVHEVEPDGARPATSRRRCS